MCWTSCVACVKEVLLTCVGCSQENMSWMYTTEILHVCLLHAQVVCFFPPGPARELPPARLRQLPPPRLRANSRRRVCGSSCRRACAPAPAGASAAALAAARAPTPPADRDRPQLPAARDTKEA